MSERTDAPHAGLFNEWPDAVKEASRRAALTGYRQRVRFEPRNEWWQITETSRLAWWQQMREAP